MKLLWLRFAGPLVVVWVSFAMFICFWLTSPPGSHAATQGGVWGLFTATLLFAQLYFMDLVEVNRRIKQTEQTLNRRIDELESKLREQADRTVIGFGKEDTNIMARP
jgi:hypothetical protein